MPVTKRLRIFAGPNGSGKSTIVGVVDKLVGCPYFVNADEIYAKLSQKGHLSFDDYLVVLDVETFREQFRRSGFFPKSAHAEELIDGIRKTGDNMLTVPDKAVDSYFAAFVADFLRDNMLNVVQQFTIETVMSDPRKADYIRTAKRLGYRIYLYFVSTKDVAINIARVAQRVQLGGHDVPQEKIEKRYIRSLENIFEVLMLCDRAYFFDNSAEQRTLLAEYETGTLMIREPKVPAWFNRYVYEPFRAEAASLPRKDITGR